MTTVTYNQHSMFDGVAAREAKEEAVARVGDNAEPDWILEALRVVYNLCLYKETFTTDDVWSDLIHKGIAGPHEPRALGAVMVKARRRGWCRPTGRYVGSMRPECHNRPIMVWQTARVLSEWDRLT